MVTVAYWDTEQRGRPPRLLGEIQGTPTIRLFKPKKKQSKPETHSAKAVVDYRQERKVKDLQLFIEDQMTNYVERISFGKNDLEKAQAKAAKYGLPQALFFTSKPKTTALLKFLSTEFRRRILLIQVTPTTKNQSILQDYGLANSPDSLPALLIVTPEGEQIQYEGGFTKRQLERFLSEHVLDEPVYRPLAENEQTDTDDATQQAVHDEM